MEPAEAEYTIVVSVYNESNGNGAVLVSAPVNLTVTAASSGCVPGGEESAARFSPSFRCKVLTLFVSLHSASSSLRCDS